MILIMVHHGSGFSELVGGFISWYLTMCWNIFEHDSSASSRDVIVNGLHQIEVLIRLPLFRFSRIPRRHPFSEAIDAIHGVGANFDIYVFFMLLHHLLNRKQLSSLVGLPISWKTSTDISRILDTIKGPEASPSCLSSIPNT